jgi:hypothetical protein
MTATATHSGFLVGLVILAVCVLVAFAVALPDCNVEVSRHAIERHGPGAVIASQWVRLSGDPGHDCPDGRTRWGVPMWPGRWAVVVREGGAFVTAFISKDGGYVRRMLKPCKPRMAH